MGTPNKYTTEYCVIATKVLADGESLAAVCDELDISRVTLYEWRNKHPEFEEAIQKGLQKAQRAWEKIGKAGIEGDIKNFSASPWIFTLKNRFRQDYADQDCLTLASQNERMKAELEELRKELDNKHKKDY